MNFFILINLFEKQEQPASNNFKWYWKKWDVSFLESFHLCELLQKENNAFKKTWMQVKNSLERNLRSINVLFSEKKQKKKMPALKLNQLLAKWIFSDDRNIYFKKKRAQLNLTLKLLFQNFLPWLYHIHCIMRTCKLRGTFINNVLYFSISQKLIMQLNVKMQTPSSSERF